MSRCATIPAGFDLRPIDDRARAGGWQLVFNGEFFALVRHVGGAWRHSSDHELDFVPTYYRAAVRHG